MHLGATVLQTGFHDLDARFRFGPGMNDSREFLHFLDGQV